MDCLGGPYVGDDEIATQAPATKGCKLPKRFFDEVDRPVPRKVRSGTKKIRRKPDSPPLLNSKRPSQSTPGVKSSSKKDEQKETADVFTFDKCGDSDILLISQRFSGKITKDEAEVVETLYTLAGMLHTRDDNSDEMSSSMAKATKENLMTLPTAEQSPIYSYSAVKKNGSVRSCSSTVLEVSNCSFKKHCLSETAKIRSMPGSYFLEPKENDLQIFSHIDREKLVGKVNQSTPLLCRAETSDELFLPKSVSQLSECPEIRVKPLSPSEAPLFERTNESATSLPGNLLAPRRTVKENKKKSAALWLGLSPDAVPGRKTNGYLLQPSPLRVTASLENGGLSRKEDECAVTEISLKRSERHVHLCRFIQGLQIRKKTESMRIQSHQLKLGTELNQEAFVGINNLNRTKDHLGEAKDIVPSDKWLHQDKQGVSLHLPSETFATQKQKFDFLSLSPGSSRVINRNKDEIDRDSKLELFPENSGFYGHINMQNQAIMTLPPAQVYYSSPQRLKQLPPPVSAIQQVPPSSSSLPSDSSDPFPQTKTKRHQEQQQHIWASQMAVQSTNWPDPATMVQFLSRTEGRSDPSNAQFDPSIFHNSHSSAEALYGYRLMFTAKQQQFASIPSSLGASGIRTQHHPLPFR